MKHKFYVIFILITYVLLSSCERIKDENTNVYENILTGKHIELEMVSNFIIEENSNQFIGTFLFVKHRMGSLVLADYLNPILFFIDKTNGKVRKIIKFKFGKGPGEVIKIGSFEILNDKIYISDMGNFRWSVFDTSGNFIFTARPFSDLPKKINEKQKGKYVGNGNIMDIYENKIYNCVIETEYNRDLQQQNSKAIAILDSSLNIIKVFGRYDKIFGEVKSYFINPQITISEDGYIYFTQAPTYRIYKYDKDGNYIKTFGVKGKFRIIDKDIPSNLPISEIMTRTLQFSVSDAIFTFKSFVLHQFLDRTEKLYETRDLLDNNYYLKVYDKNGNYFQSDIKLPGWLMTVDNDGLLYIYEKNEPGNRQIGVYRIKLVDDL
ncbi:Hypothetical protein IALB_0686 [Ignavibacterium album JCM 16511]|uniref:6-bladed beta-propeller n=1 Tax=Ignavibacterium album (strain DSM 19864 / JCM 16511 / NBRC 101810 / Mat9-16) TaxID=945713 RepID=I0AHE1_IGNAJ|nr:hypothetical protein [Ignavibacterium album]AFH48398.1 Hypothetical protein IALB_0686 [Ignavibacterium album JCM 16511]